MIAKKEAKFNIGDIVCVRGKYHLITRVIDISSQNKYAKLRINSLVRDWWYTFDEIRHATTKEKAEYLLKQMMRK